MQHILFDGWLIRFAEGYTRRANSVTALHQCRLDMQQKVTICEHLYAARNLPTIFRLTPFAGPPALDAVLEQRGYTIAEPSLVLYRRLSRANMPTQPNNLHILPLDDWMTYYCQLQHVSTASQHNHRAILDAIRATRLPAILSDDNRPVACVLGILIDRCIGLFDLITAPQ